MIPSLHLRVVLSSQSSAVIIVIVMVCLSLHIKAVGLQTYFSLSQLGLSPNSDFTFPRQLSLSQKSQSVVVAGLFIFISDN